MNARAWFAFLTVSLLWGIPYLFIKVAVDDGIPPAFLAWIRVTIAAVILGLLSWRLGLLSGLRGRWRVLALYATVEIAIPFPLIGFGEQRVSSSLAAILIASVPLIIALIALRFDHEERASGSRLVGLFVGFAGVVALVGIDVAGNSRELVGAIAVLVAAVGYAIGPMLIKPLTQSPGARLASAGVGQARTQPATRGPATRGGEDAAWHAPAPPEVRRGSASAAEADLAEVDPRAMMAGALALAAVILTPAAIAAPPDATLTAEAIAAIIVLSVLCTAVAFVVFAMLIGEVGPSRASVITYVAPVVAVALGVAVLDERPGAGAIAGLLLILAGSWLATGGKPPSGLAAVITRLRIGRPRPAPSTRRVLYNPRAPG